ncbi:MAG: right-handed parallel beta-helix repeat-containing protein [Gammaproteobacteria bacterium]
MILSKIIQIIRTGFTIISIIWGTAFAATINVSTVTQLENAVATANSSGGNTTILMQDGVYTLNDTLYINAPAVTITSQSGNRENVIIQGDAMSSTARVGNVIRVAASSFKLDGITLQKSRWHLIQIAGERNADNPIIRNCIFRDAYEQMLKVSVGNNPSNPSVSSDNGLVENCLFEYSAEIGPQYYIGGIDAHGAKNWTVRNNTFRNIISPSSAVAEFAIHFWNYSANNTIEKNLIMNCDRGIGFGLAGRPNNGGVIRNNMIYHTANKGQFADTAIALTESPNTQVYNNTIFMKNSFPWAIEYRFTSTQNVLIANNLTNKPIQSRDGATGTIAKNVTNATGTWFVNRSSGDLHLASAVSTVVDMGQVISGLSDDFDGQNRPQGMGIDIGADEHASNLSLQPPANLRIVTP